MNQFRVSTDSFPPVVKNLLIINVLVYIAQITVGTQIDLTSKLMLWPILAPDFLNFKSFRPEQLFTHLFAHSPSSFFHILFNMFALWMFGRVLENVWGAKRFLFFYIACGLGAAACHLLVEYIRYEQILVAIEAGNEAAVIRLAQTIGPALGASGAIMGVFAAFAYLFPNTELYIMFIPFPIKAKWAVVGLAAIDLFTGVANFQGDNIAHFAHLGGAITGFIIVLIWNKTNRKTLY